MYFIEKIKSTFTGNTWYSSQPSPIRFLKHALSETEKTRYLKTLDVIIFHSMKEKDGIYWYEGIRKLQPTPWVYTIPPLHFLNGTRPPKAVMRYETVKRQVAEVKAKAGELFS